MFKILGLNCLATAYVLSVMYLDGVKLGDMQATTSGIFTAAFFLFISHARPLDKRSAQRPHPNIFCSYVFLSLLGQFAIHLTFLISTVKEAEKYMPEECVEPDSEFHPNLVNSHLGGDHASAWKISMVGSSFCDIMYPLGPVLALKHVYTMISHHLQVKT